MPSIQGRPAVRRFRRRRRSRRAPSAPAPQPAPQQTAQTPAHHDHHDADDDDDADTTTTTPTTPTVGTGPIKHVFVISLSSPGYDQTFGDDSLMPYLNGKLRPEGELLSEYSLLTAAGLPNRIAAISGQPPNALTKANCKHLHRLRSRCPARRREGWSQAPGCIYPVQALTIADQLGAGGLTWRAYMEDMEGQVRPGQLHPSGLRRGRRARAGWLRLRQQNPFAYFHSLLDLAACSANDMPFDTLQEGSDEGRHDGQLHLHLAEPLQRGRDSPCDDADPGEVDPVAPRQDPPTTTTTTTTEPTTTTPEPTTTVPAPTLPDAPGVIDDATERIQAATSADEFLEKWVPQSLKSPAYKKDGALFITFGAAQPADDAEDPNKVGTLLLSKDAPAGLSLGAEYDPYSLLRSTQDLFGLSPLANAGAESTLSFASQLTGAGD